MKIPFNVGPHQCLFTRSWATGSTKIVVDGQPFQLQSAISVASVFDVKLTRAWEGQVDGNVIHIEKRRPLIYPAFRKHTYSIWVNGVPMLTCAGY